VFSFWNLEIYLFFLNTQPMPKGRGKRFPFRAFEEGLLQLFIKELKVRRVFKAKTGQGGA
jgi:hypothetical protein